MSNVFAHTPLKAIAEAVNADDAVRADAIVELHARVERDTARFDATGKGEGKVKREVAFLRQLEEGERANHAAAFQAGSKTPVAKPEAAAKPKGEAKGADPLAAAAKALGVDATQLAAFVSLARKSL